MATPPRNNPRANTATAPISVIPPHDFDTEAQLIGSAMLDGRAALTVSTLHSDLFYRPAYAAAAKAITSLIAAGIKPDPAEVLGALGDNLGLFANPSDLTTLQNTGLFTDGSSLARRLHSLHRARQALGIAKTITEACGAGALSTIDQAITQLEELGPPTSGTHQPTTIDAFLNQTDAEHRWLVEGWLERTDRIVFVGQEGKGKSTLLRQIGMRIAGGIHPWDLNHIDPVKVQLIDFENSPDQLRRELRKMRTLVNGPIDLTIETRPGGINLLDPNDIGWLASTVAAAAPDVVITGPTYKMVAGPQDEETIGELTRAIDKIRVANDIAILLEAHEGHASDGRIHRPGRPIGSSVWLRWPEFGVNLDFHDDGSRVELKRFRGDRDARIWPTILGRGVPGNWPWVTLSSDPLQTVPAGTPRDEACRESCLAWLQAHPGEMFGVNEMVDNVLDFHTRKRFRKATVIDALRAIVGDHIDVTEGSRGALLYRWANTPETPQEDF